MHKLIFVKINFSTKFAFHKMKNNVFSNFLAHFIMHKKESSDVIHQSNHPSEACPFVYTSNDDRFLSRFHVKGNFLDI